MANQSALPPCWQHHCCCPGNGASVGGAPVAAEVPWRAQEGTPLGEVRDNRGDQMMSGCLTWRAIPRLHCCGPDALFLSGATRPPSSETAAPAPAEIWLSTA